MSQLSDARGSCARRALIECDGDTEAAKAVAEKYYRRLVSREVTMNELHDMVNWIDRVVAEKNAAKTKAVADQYRRMKG